MSIDIVALDPPDEATVEQAYQVFAAGIRAETPDFPPLTRQTYAAALRNPAPGYRILRFVARLGGVASGYLEVQLPELDNVDNAAVELYTHPEHRRRGVGRALLDHARRVVNGLGRKRITGMTVVALPGGAFRDAAGQHFASGSGAVSALAEVRRRLEVPTVDQAVLDRSLIEAYRHAAGYSLLRWQDPTPDEYLADVAYLESRLLADAPLGALEWEPENVDAERIRQTEIQCRRRRRRLAQAGVRHDATGRIVGWTMLHLQDDARWHAFQQTTLVDPEHRGHRLGLILKIENLRNALACEPELRAIDTWNAADNGHMIAINEAVGFRPVDSWLNWQLTL
ncbi:GNAT family N-acetyltransferase [Plantactinospora sp. GCM10030261]|uniref:GNAT family N-acetyltransferase n=1 Tax=Plantactinospora sp. GCM10030261 TaxID=3273420 RepID=UPI003614390C